MAMRLAGQLPVEALQLSPIWRCNILQKYFATFAKKHLQKTSEVIVVGAGADAVDYKLISICHKGDIVVSQDYGVAAMALGKGAYAIHQSGKWYTNENIDQMLMERHLNKKARRGSHKNHLKGPRRRTEEDDKRFAQSGVSGPDKRRRLKSGK